MERERYAVGLRRVEHCRKLQALKGARKLLRKARRLIKSHTKTLKVPKNKQKESGSPFVDDLFSITASIKDLDLEDNLGMSQEVPEVPTETVTDPADDQNLKIILKVNFGNGRLSSEIRRGGQQHVSPVAHKNVKVENDQVVNAVFQTTLPIRIKSEHNISENIKSEDSN